MVTGGILIVPAGLEIPSSFGKASLAPSSQRVVQPNLVTLEGLRR
jgi:hypothetical protein